MLLFAVSPLQYRKKDLSQGFPLRQRLIEARKRRLLSASEADTAVALSVGTRPAGRAGVDRAASLRRNNLIRQAIGAIHVFVVGPCGIGRAHIGKRQADAVAALHIALTAGDTVVHIATHRSAKRISLILADLD